MSASPNTAAAEEAAMARALELAWRGWGRVAPNPLVGAVILADGGAVADGWHAEFGGAHAEVEALRAAGARARGATLVVTLEPCAHHGKTPPCTDAIRAAGVARVVAAVRDPHPDARGGLDALRAAGIDTAWGPLAERAAAQNAAFLCALERRERPWVAVKLAVSADGRIADARGDSRWVSGPEARGWVHWLRAGFDAVAVGAGTARRDDPLLTVRGDVTPRVTPTRVVFDRHAALSPAARLVRTARETPTWLVTAPDAPADAVARLEREGVRVVRAESLAAALALLRAGGIRSLLCEGGGTLAGALIAERLADRLYRVEAPVWLGEAGVPAFPGLPGGPIAEAPRWIPVERRALGADTLLVLDRTLCLPVS